MSRIVVHNTSHQSPFSLRSLRRLLPAMLFGLSVLTTGNAVGQVEAPETQEPEKSEDRIRLDFSTERVEAAVFGYAAGGTSTKIEASRMLEAIKPWLEAAEKAKDGDRLLDAVMVEAVEILNDPEVQTNNSTRVKKAINLLETGGKRFLKLKGEKRDAALTEVLQEFREYRIERSKAVFAARQKLNWAEWRSIPVLHDGRIMPLETYAGDMAVLVTGRSKWTDPDTGLKFTGPELLFRWTAGSDDSLPWQQVIRCEYQPLREVLDSRRVQSEELAAEKLKDGRLTFAAIEKSGLIPGQVEGKMLVKGQAVARFTSASNGLLTFFAADANGQGSNAEDSGARWYEEVRRGLLESAGDDIPAIGQIDYSTGQISITLADGQKVAAADAKLVVQYDYRRGQIPSKGTYVSLMDIYDWDAVTKGKDKFWSDDFRERVALVQSGRDDKKSAGQVGATAEDRQLSIKISELYGHLRALTRAYQGNSLFVLPSLDPRALADPLKAGGGDSTKKPIDAWVPLGSVREASKMIRALEDRKRQKNSEAENIVDGPKFSTVVSSNPTLHAVLTKDEAHVLLQQLLFGYPKDHIIQLAKANTFRETMTPMVTTAGQHFERAANSYATLDAERFAESTRDLRRSLRKLGNSLTAARSEMTPVTGKSEVDRMRALRALAVLEGLRGALDDKPLQKKAEAVGMGDWLQEQRSDRVTTQILDSLELRRKEFEKAELPAPGILNALEQFGQDENVRLFGKIDEDIYRRHPGLMLSGAEIGNAPLDLDEKQIAYSDYPESGSLAAELQYNKLKPFSIAWIVFLISFIIVCISLMMKRPVLTYMLGLAVAGAAVGFSAYGFYARIVIAGRAPVTSMYETVIWVSFIVGAMGLWFNLLPFLWPGLSWAWRLTSFPLTLGKNPLGGITGVKLDEPTPTERGKLFGPQLNIFQFIGTTLTIGAFSALMWMLTLSETSYDTLDLPDIATTGLSSRLLTFLVGATTCVVCCWYISRAAVTILVGLLTVWSESARIEKDTLWAQVFSRRWFLLGALPVACFGMMLSHWVGIRAPEILNPQITGTAAVLRNNYWLSVHVLTIVSSYGAGALAWGLGNLAMLYYLLGRYQKKESTLQPIETSLGVHAPAVRDSIGTRMGRARQGMKWSLLRRTLKASDESADGTVSKVAPPKEVNALAQFGYKAMQVATLLLAVGTILGGLWADVSWGRFWDWDPKEVWALISLLVYLAVLHGRFAGWVGTFGTNVGAVACFSAILMSWYGVNYVLPKIPGLLDGGGGSVSVGLHSYAGGEADGLGYVIAAVLLNAGLVFLAWGRYSYETLSVASTTEGAPGSDDAGLIAADSEGADPAPAGSTHA